MANLPVFAHPEFEKVRIITRSGEPWFVASDVAKALGYEKPNNAINDHCKKVSKFSYPESRQLQPYNIIPEMDVYRLIMRSNLPSAERFQDWVVEDVLPSIRKTGRYAIEPSTLTPFIQIKVLPKARRDQLNELTLAKLTHVPPALIWKVRMSIWKAFNRHFAIPQYRLLPENRMAEAISFLSEMEGGPRGTVARKSAHLPLPLDEARQAISALTACIEQARSVLAALPESQRQETI